MISLALLGTLTLAWNANNEPDIATYKLYYGTQSGRYIDGYEVGNVTTHRVSPAVLQPGQQIFFVVTAINTTGLESDYSNEVSYTAPVEPAPPTLDITIAAGKVTIAWKTQIGFDYTVWYRDDETELWGKSVVIPGDGLDAYWTEIADRPKRIYRVEVTPKQN